MKVAPRKSNTSNTYFRLIREFALKPLRNDAELEAANRVALRLAAAKPEDEMDSGERDYFDALAVLIQDAERHMLLAATRNTTPLKLIQHLMHERHMSVSDLGLVVGSQPAASLILAGKRQISKSQIQRLAEHFKLSPAAFIG